MLAVIAIIEIFPIIEIIVIIDTDILQTVLVGQKGSKKSQKTYSGWSKSVLCTFVLGRGIV